MSIDMRDTAVALAAYNRWVNGQLYAAAGSLPDEARRREVGGAFSSVHGTLAHLVAADIVWLQRFRGEPVAAPEPARLETFEGLSGIRRLTDDAIDAWASSIDAGFASRPFHFVSKVYNRERTVPGWAAVLHFFNHQTHHRGQVTTQLRLLGATGPLVADVPWMPYFDVLNPGG